MKIIAELGSNWKSFEDCKNAINLAKACGADAIKFQLFSARELYGVDPADGSTRIGLGLPYDPEAWQFDSVALPPDWLPKLKIKSDAAGIELMCTAFSPEGYDIVNPYVSTHKVASAEMTHVRILEKVGSFGKAVILSTGASGPEDIRQSLRVLEEHRLMSITLMYCVAAYPAHEIDFRQLDFLKRFAHPVGYSDHSTDVLCIPKLAQDHGATVLEKHFNPFNYIDTPDAGHSLNVDQFKKMVRHLKGDLPFAWGSGEENEMVLRHNRRIIATRKVQKGDEFTESGEASNCGIYRSLKNDTRGLSPFAIEHVNGKRATRDIEAGEAIGPGDFE